MKLEHLIPHLESILMSLKPHICKWKASQLHKNTCRLPAKVEDTKYVEDLWVFFIHMINLIGYLSVSHFVLSYVFVHSSGICVLHFGAPQIFLFLCSPVTRILFLHAYKLCFKVPVLCISKHTTYLYFCAHQLHVFCFSIFSSCAPKYLYSLLSCSPNTCILFSLLTKDARQVTNLFSCLQVPIFCQCIFCLVSLCSLSTSDLISLFTNIL